MNEQLEFLRLCIIDAEDIRKQRIKLFELHYPRLLALAELVRGVRPTETRTTILLGRFDECVPKRTLMPLADILCEIYHKTNRMSVRRLIDAYEGGWNGSNNF